MPKKAVHLFKMFSFQFVADTFNYPGLENSV